MSTKAFVQFYARNVAPITGLLLVLPFGVILFLTKGIFSGLVASVFYVYFIIVTVPELYLVAQSVRGSSSQENRQMAILGVAFVVCLMLMAGVWGLMEFLGLTATWIKLLPMWPLMILCTIGLGLSFRRKTAGSQANQTSEGKS